MSSSRSINILIPTFERLSALTVTLTSLYYQSEKDFDVIIADQSDDDTLENDASIQTIMRLLRLQNSNVFIFKNLPRRGMAQQRDFLLQHSTGRFSLFLDDDLILDRFVVRNLKQVLESEVCGFAGCAPIGLSYKNDERPHQQQIEFWNECVEPENIVPKSAAWQRYQLHNAANIYHVGKKYNATPDAPKLYKVAWVGGCVMYDTEKLRACGGFNFWTELPDNHCGEDVLAQLRVMKRYGGCGVIPSGVYHQELATTVPDRTINAPECLEI